MDSGCDSSDPLSDVSEEVLSAGAELSDEVSEEPPPQPAAVMQIISRTRVNAINLFIINLHKIKSYY
jgi:hypothetical protein